MKDIPNIFKLTAMWEAIQRDKHDPEDTLMLQLTHREVAIMVSGVVLIDILFPEFVELTDELVVKLKDVTDFTKFFSTRTDDGEET